MRLRCSGGDSIPTVLTRQEETPMAKTRKKRAAPGRRAPAARAEGARAAHRAQHGQPGALRRLERPAGRVRVRRERHGGDREVGGMKSTVLLTKKGTRANVLAAIRDAAKQLKTGDSVLPHLLRPRRPGARRDRRRRRQAGRDLVPVRRPAHRRRAVLRTEPLRRRCARARAFRQLPQRHRDARAAAEPRRPATDARR